jgi:hypothetical protein
MTLQGADGGTAITTENIKSLGKRVVRFASVIPSATARPKAAIYSLVPSGVIEMSLA